jgi:uncharacterized protein YndB with AHSA1/START domain
MQLYGCIMITSEMSKIEKRMLLRAPRAKVWRALTHVPEFAKWFGVTMEGEFQPGARLEMTATKDGSTMVVHVTIEQMEPESLFSWRWHPGVPRDDVDYSAEPTTLVEFHLEESTEGTLLTVKESGFDQISLTRRASVFGDNDRGWDGQMKSLAKYVG